MRTSLLDQIRTMEDLRRLPESDLATLADELRGTTISAVSKTGGHLGAGLGVVELTSLASSSGVISPITPLLNATEPYVPKAPPKNTSYSVRCSGGILSANSSEIYFSSSAMYLLRITSA